MAALFCCMARMYGQTAAGSTAGISYEQTVKAPAMKWSCPDIEKYQELLLSLKNDDYKIYASNVKEKIELYTDPKAPKDKYLVTQAVFAIENPLFKTENLLNHISAWIRSKHKDWAKNMKTDVADKSIVSTAKVQVASHGSFIDLYKVYVEPSLAIRIIEGNRLLVSFITDSYSNAVYDSNGRFCRSYNDRISGVFPFVPKSSYKNTYAKAYVGTYLYFWRFIGELQADLNANFCKDSALLCQMQYQHSQDSLKAMYGEPTKVFAEQAAMPDIHKELRFYEKAQKVVFMGKTIAFRDIMSCQILDDPQFVPGRTTSYGIGFSLFGIGIGGTDSYTTPGKTIHSYVVNVKIDSMSCPLIYLATGQDNKKANEIAAVFEYIIRHQESPKPKAVQKTRTTRR